MNRGNLIHRGKAKGHVAPEEYVAGCEATLAVANVGKRLDQH
jgi:hypothetical protein